MSKTWCLFDEVLKLSDSKGLDDALNEWEITNNIENDTTCVCGKKHIVDTYELTNNNNGNILYPVGSSCIKKFNNPKLNSQLKVVSHRNTILKNEGRKHDGKTYDWICKNDPQYVEYLQAVAIKKKYKMLVEYYNYYHYIKNC
jgi:hypothetical protein